MKNRAFLISLVVIVCAALLGCDMPVLNNNLREPFVTLVEIPGEVRSLSAAPGARTVHLTWKDPTDTNFDHAEISYSANNGSIHILPPVGKGVEMRIIENLDYGITYAFTVKLVDTDGNKSHGSLVIVSLARVVDDLDLAQYITAPVAGATPDTRPIRGTQYTGKVVWTKTDGAFSGNFVKNIAYRADVTLTANAGYTFADLGNENGFTYAGAPSVDTGVAGHGTIIFPELGPAWYVANYGNDISGNGLASTTALKTVDKALKKIEDDHTAAKASGPLAPNGLPNATIVVIGTSGDTKTILIDNNNANKYPPITLRGLSPAQPGILTADKDGWTNSDGTTSLVADAYRVLEITNGAKVTLGNDLTLTGGGQRTVGSNYLGGPGIYVHETSILIMNGGTVTGNTTTTTAGSGAVSIKNSTFTMNSGIISHNYGFFTGGVAVQDNSTFTMAGGAITNNDSYSTGGGVRVMGGSTFTMTGGTISTNTSEIGWGGGVAIESSSFTMSGGTISGNTAPRNGGGVMVGDNGTFTMDGGTISDNIANEYGGGVNVGTGSISFTMHGGTIAGNTAVSGGGGVSVLGGVFKKEPLVSSDSSGIIYGNDGTVNRNKATLADSTHQNRGHTVYIAAGPKTRETTVTAYESLDSGEDDGWAE
jgi:hypothetical protein